MDALTEKTFRETDNTSHLVWKSAGERLLVKTPIFDVCMRHDASTDGREGDFVFIDSPQWACVVPFFTGTDGKPRFVMVKQYRHGNCMVTYEFPGGIVDDGEKPYDAAMRELKEETGLSAGSLKLIGEVSPNAAIMNNRQYFFLAEDMKDSKSRNLDENEQIDVVTVPVDEVLSNLGTGSYDNGIMLIAAYYFLRDKGKICF